MRLVPPLLILLMSLGAGCTPRPSAPEPQPRSVYSRPEEPAGALVERMSLREQRALAFNQPRRPPPTVPSPLPPARPRPVVAHRLVTPSPRPDRRVVDARYPTARRKAPQSAAPGPVEVALAPEPTPTETEPAQDVEVGAQFGSAQILSTGQPRLVYLLVEASAVESKLEPLPINLALVIDASGSMNGQKLDYAIEAVSQAMGRIRPIDTCAVVVFAESARTVARSDAMRRDLGALIRGAGVGGGTHMSAGIEAAVAEVGTRSKPGNLNHILLLTDGETDDAGQCTDACLRAHRQGISFSTIGLGRGFNEGLLQELAERSNGRFYALDAPSQLPAIFDVELKGVRETQLRNNRLILTLEKGVTVRHAHRIKPGLRDLGEPAATPNREVTVPMGDLHHGETLSVLFEVLLQDRRPGRHRLATARVEHDQAGEGGTKGSGSHPIEVQFTADRARAAAGQNPAVNAAVDAVTRFTHRGAR